MHPLRVALAGFIDYAGLFPPASLDLDRTAANHRRYAASPDAWLLGRLIVPAQRLGELSASLAPLDGHDGESWTISALVRTGSIADDLTAIERFNARHAPRIAVVAVETVAASVADVTQVSRGIDAGLERYIEVPVDGDTDALLDAIRDVGCYAKLRTGGTAPDRFPSAHDVARVIAGCDARGVPFKATAGLHHAVRNEFSVTGRRDGGSALMHGFINVLVAAVLCSAGLREPGQLEEVLEERNPHAFVMENDGMRWREAFVSNEECAEARAHLLRSIGSCSVEEPVAELRALGWWPDDLLR
jgi:hypothetical protein